MYKFALIGCGRIALRHIENIIKIGKLVAVCDTDKIKADAFASQYLATAYYNIDTLLQNESEVDIVVVCTPNGFHAEHSIKSLQAGKHVLCEKPMCITSAAAWQMIETEKFSRKKLFIVKSTRYNPLLQQLKQLLDTKALGQIFSFDLKCFWNRPPAYYTDWRGKLFPDGGTLYTQFSHYIDAMIWLFGEMKAVRGFSANKAHKGVIEFEDTGVAALQMMDGTLGSLHWSVNTFQKNSEINLTIIAESGTLSIGGPYLNKICYTQLKEPLSFVESYNEANNYGFYEGSMSNHKEVYENLVKALDNNLSPFINGFDGLKTVETIEKIYKVVTLID